MSKKSSIMIVLGAIVLILTIISLTQGIFGISPIKEWTIFQPKEENPIEILIKPNYINEGQYKGGIDIEITIPNLKENNITSLKLTQSNIIVDRLNKNDQTEVSSYVRWEDEYNDNYLFHYTGQQYLPFSGTLEAKGKLFDCENCFMGEDSPYIFTFVIQYTQGDEPLTTATIKVEVPII